METEKVKVDFFSQPDIKDFIAPPKELKGGINPMAVVSKLMSDPKKMKSILMGVVLFWIVGACSSVYFTVVYYNVLVPIYILLFASIYVFGKRKTIGDKIKNIFTKKNK